MFPEVITTNYIISQALGLVAIAIVISSYFVNIKKKQMTLRIIADVFVSGSFLFLGTYVACIGIIIAIVRTIIFLIYEFKFKQVPVWLIGVIFLVLVTNSAVFMTSPLDLLPMFALMLFTLGFRIRRLVYMRLFFVTPLIMFLIYDVMIFAYTDIILKVIELVLTVIITSRFFIRKAKLEKLRVTEDLQGEMEEISDD